MSLHDIWRGDVMPLSGVAVAIGRNSYDPPAPVVPVFDIHQRSAVFHDSGRSSNNSGILFFNANRDRLEINPCNSGAQPIVTAVCFEAYDNTGGSGITATGNIIAFDTVRVNTHPSVFVYDSSNGNQTLQINASGLYEFSYRGGFDNASATFNNLLMRVERKAPGGLFATIPASHCEAWFRNNATLADDGFSSVTFLFDNVTPGDKFRVFGIIETAVAAGTEPTQLANYCGLLVRKLA